MWESIEQQSAVVQTTQPITRIEDWLALESHGYEIKEPAVEQEAGGHLKIMGYGARDDFENMIKGLLSTQLINFIKQIGESVLPTSPDTVMALNKIKNKWVELDTQHETWHVTDARGAVDDLEDMASEGLTEYTGDGVDVEPVNPQYVVNQYKSLEGNWFIRYKAFILDSETKTQIGACDIEAEYEFADDSSYGIKGLAARVTRVKGMSEQKKKIESVVLDENADINEVRIRIRNALFEDKGVVVRVTHPAMKRIAESLKQTGVVVRDKTTEVRESINNKE